MSAYIVTAEQAKAIIDGYGLAREETTQVGRKALVTLARSHEALRATLQAILDTECLAQDGSPWAQDNAALHAALKSARSLLGES